MSDNRVKCGHCGEKHDDAFQCQLCCLTGFYRTQKIIREDLLLLSEPDKRISFERADRDAMNLTEDLSMASIHAWLVAGNTLETI